MIMRTTNFTIAGILLLLDAGNNAVDADIMNTHNHDRFENTIRQDERQRRVQQNNNRAVDNGSARAGRNNNQGWQNNDSAVYTVTDEDVITDINPAIEIRAQQADARAEKRRQGDNNGARQNKEPRTERRKRADAGNDDAHTNDMDTNDKQDTSDNQKEGNSQTSTNGSRQQPKKNENGNDVQIDAEKKNDSGNKLSQKEKKAKNKVSFK